MDTTNEPVAWMMVNRENTSAYLTFEKPTRDMKISHEPTPLYTHPHSEESVKVKELTDEEKWKLWGECPNGLVYDRVMMFADLVLRKANEK